MLCRCAGSRRGWRGGRRFRLRRAPIARFLVGLVGREGGGGGGEGGPRPSAGIEAPVLSLKDVGVGGILVVCRVQRVSWLELMGEEASYISIPARG